MYHVHPGTTSELIEKTGKIEPIVFFIGRSKKEKTSAIQGINLALERSPSLKFSYDVPQPSMHIVNINILDADAPNVKKKTRTGEEWYNYNYVWTVEVYISIINMNLAPADPENLTC